MSEVDASKKAAIDFGNASKILSLAEPDPKELQADLKELIIKFAAANKHVIALYWKIKKRVNAPRIVIDRLEPEKAIIATLLSHHSLYVGKDVAKNMDVDKAKKYRDDIIKGGGTIFLAQDVLFYKAQCSSFVAFGQVEELLDWMKVAFHALICGNGIWFRYTLVTYIYIYICIIYIYIYIYI